MIPKERFESALAMEAPDRPPLFYQHLSGGRWVLREAGSTIREGFSDPEVFARICMTPKDMFGFDNLMAGWGDILVEAQALGTRIGFPERDFYPRSTEYAIQGPEDVHSLEPVDPMDDPLWSVPLKAARMMVEQEKEMAVVGALNSPFVVASELWGYENLLFALLSDPGVVHSLLSTVSESEMMFGDHLMEAGVDICFIEDATAGAAQNSPELSREFDVGHCKEVTDHLHDIGIRTLLHNCAESPYLEMQLDEIGPTAIHFNVEEVDMDDLLPRIRGRCCLMPGVDHRRLLFQGTPDQVRSEVGRIVGMMDPAGLIMAPGCEMPFKTPMENIRAFREAVVEFSP
ncbi:MAG: uroporphyrinogen decarboxylase family protein [Methanomassiliicoccales archaeon]